MQLIGLRNHGESKKLVIMAVKIRTLQDLTHKKIERIPSLNHYLRNLSAISATNSRASSSQTVAVFSAKTATTMETISKASALFAKKHSDASTLETKTK